MPPSARPLRRSYSSTNIKYRLLKPLQRRVSDSATEAVPPQSSELSESLRNALSPPPPHSSHVTSTSNIDPLSELSPAQSPAPILRNNQRALSPQQASPLTSTSQRLASQSRTIRTLTSLNADLAAHLGDALAAGKNLLTRFKDVVSKHDALVDQLHEANRAVLRLKKSDRAKGKVQQRNLRLKATIRSHQCGGRGREEALLEALALASERIEELESAGERVLDALDGDDSGSEDGDGEGDEEGGVGLLEAGVVFRGVLEDETFREQKVLWGELLET